MKKNILIAVLLVSSAFAVSALAPSAALARVLKPGSYSLGGVQQICLVPDGTWYSETFQGSSGRWMKGPTAEDSTLIFGHYASGAGSDSIVVTKLTVDWMEWNVADGKQVFMDSISITGAPGRCTPPATRVTPGHNNPMD